MCFLLFSIVGELFSGPAFGIGILAAGVILAIMIIPYIASARDVFEQTPVMMKESAYGIGCAHGNLNIVSTLYPNGVIGGVMLDWTCLR